MTNEQLIERLADALSNLMSAQSHYDRMLVTSTRDNIDEAAEDLHGIWFEAQALVKQVRSR